ncbi:MAG: hypothetical protein JW888_15815 [Pirellulales bacterium]|nr:hypothetical protein [Pirellulales bacterium]
MLRKLTEVLESLEIPYLITGSTATIAYGEPRFTNDVDVVAALAEAKVDGFCAAFPAPEFYCHPDAVRRAVTDRSQFNIIHPASGLKVDVMIPAETPFNRSRLNRGVRIPAGPGFSARFASAEDVIIKKLEYYREGGSEKHLRDIAGVLKVQANRVDREYIADWVAKLGLTNEWQMVLAQEAKGAS